MLAFNLKLSKLQQAELDNQLVTAETKGDLSEVKRVLALLSLAAGIHMCYFPTFDDLKNKVNIMLHLFQDAKNEVLALFGLYDELNVA